ncbi:hypothetical protein HG531_013194 [Fusarium graminearum]|nr:hypothetical protein HG531_013194 [Fusarium graminearum]
MNVPHAASRTSRTTIGTGKDSDSNEGSNKGNVQKNPKPAKPSGTTALEKQRDDHANEGVQHSSSKDALDSAKGSTDTLSGLDNVDDFVDLAETSRK